MLMSAVHGLQGDDLKSRYLLTFASAAIANEWWLHLQTHFPDASRPGPQLFSFKTDDLLSKAWKHPSFAHLKSKWMYISFSDTPGDGLGGAAQGIIPVQDAQGNLLGGSAPASPEVREAKREAKGMRNEVHRLEEHFERMMEAVQKTTDKVSELVERQSGSLSEDGTTKVGSESSAGGCFDMDVLSTHFGRMNELLARNSEHVEDLAKKHYENEQKLRQTMEAVVSKQQNDYLDMQQLSSHLDRIQNMMENSATERKDSAREVAPVAQIDFSPLTQRLEKVQEAVEQNSALVKALLDERTTSADEQSANASRQPQLDLTPLAEHLERIHSAIEQQGEHTSALVGFASGEREPRVGADMASGGPASLAPLGEHLEQIYNAIEEGNKTNGEHMQQLMEYQSGTLEAVQANGGEIDFTPFAEHLDALREASDGNMESIKELLQADRGIDISPLTDHLEAIRTATENNAKHMRGFIDSQQASAARSSESNATFDITPLTDRLKRIHSTLEKHGDYLVQSPGTGDSKFLLNALTSHLSKIQSVTDQNAQALKSFRGNQATAQDRMHGAVAETAEQVRALVQRNGDQEARIEAQNSQTRELMSAHREMVEVMRELSRSIVAQNKGACDHVVVPPPRKMGRKVVGFVYDAKEGPA